MVIKNDIQPLKPQPEVVDQKVKKQLIEIETLKEMLRGSSKETIVKNQQIFKLKTKLRSMLNEQATPRYVPLQIASESEPPKTTFKLKVQKKRLLNDTQVMLPQLKKMTVNPQTLQNASLELSEVMSKSVDRIQKYGNVQRKDPTKNIVSQNIWKNQEEEEDDQEDEEGDDKSPFFDQRNKSNLPTTEELMSINREKLNLSRNLRTNSKTQQSIHKKNTNNIVNNYTQQKINISYKPKQQIMKSKEQVNQDIDYEGSSSEDFESYKLVDL